MQCKIFSVSRLLPLSEKHDLAAKEVVHWSTNICATSVAKLSCFVVFVNWISFRAVIGVFVLQHYCTRLAQTWTYVAAVVYAGHTCRPVAHGELRGYWPTPPVLIIVNIQKAKDCSASTFCLNDSRKLLLVENVLPVLGSAAHRSGSQVIVREPGAPSPRLMTGSVHPVAAQSPALPLYSAVMCISSLRHIYSLYVHLYSSPSVHLVAGPRYPLLLLQLTRCRKLPYCVGDCSCDDVGWDHVPPCRRCRRSLCYLKCTIRCRIKFKRYDMHCTLGKLYILDIMTL